MEKALQIVIEQMSIWAQQYSLPVTDEFKSLYNALTTKSTFSFNPAELNNNLYKSRERNYYSISPKLYTVEEIDIQKEYKLVQPKIVKIREARRCEQCKRQLPAGTMTLTTTMRVNGKGKRFWFCVDCANKLVADAKRKSAQLYDNEEPDWDDGRSSNGY